MMRIEQLVARVARTAAHATRVASSSRIARARHPLQHVAGFATTQSSSTGVGRKKQPQSFAIAEAFEGLDDDSNDDDDSDDRTRSRRDRDSSSSSAESDVTREFHAAMEKKKLWLQTLAQQRKFAHIVKAVDDCYAPLYALPTAEPLRTTRALLTQHFDARRVETKYQPQLFNDTLTRTTEQEALALLVIAREGALARAVFAHRRALAAALTDTPIVLSDASTVTSASVMDDTLQQPLDLTTHFRSFYSWGMGAYSLASDYAAIFALYEAALAANVYPTASMHATYVKALVSARRPAADVRAFYRDVMAQRRPTNIFFYRELLFFASVQHDTALLLELLEAMKVKGFKLRADDYLHAIKAFDDQYYLTPRKSQFDKRSSSGAPEATISKLTTPLDTHATCVARMHEQDEHPEQFQDLDAAAHSVLALFDEMVDEERLAPTSEQFFPRVIAAAVYAREFPKALTFVELFDKHCRGKTLHHAGVRMAVNALLLLDEPERAWALVRSACPTFELREFAHVANIVEYLCRQNNAAQLLALLRDAQELRILPLFSNNTVKLLLPALVRSVDTISDEQLWDTVCAFDKVFHVRTKPHAYSQFLNECVFRKRLGAAKRAFKQRDERRVGKLKARLALRMALAFADAGDDAVLPEILKAVDAAAAKPDELAELVFVVIRANARLGRSSDNSKHVFALHVAPLVASGKLHAELVPADVAAIVA